MSSPQPDLPELVALAARARAERPGITVTDERFMPYLRQRLAAVQPRHVGDLLLACAALNHDREAVDQIERLCAATAQRNAVDARPEFRDELRQALLVSLLTGDGRRRKLEAYAGRGALTAWLAALAFALALNLRRAARVDRDVPELSFAESVEVLIDFQTPELLSLKQQSLALFKRAVQTAVNSLDPREQHVLKLRCVEGVSAKGIAAFYKVTVPSVTRWILGIRSKLLKQTRVALGTQVADVDSLIRTLQGEIDASLERFFDAA